MKLKNVGHLGGRLEVAHRLAETIVFRTRDGQVLAIQVAESLVADLVPSFGADVTRMGE